MFTGLLPISFLAFGGCAAGQDEATKRDFTGFQYDDFGSVQTGWINALEEQVLDSLCKYSMKHHSPEIPSATVSKILPYCPARDKARSLLLRLLDRSCWSPLSVEHHLSKEASFSGILLLSKLFHFKHLNTLKMVRRDEDGDYDREVFCLFVDAANKHRGFAGWNGNFLSNVMSQALSLGITRFVEENAAKITGIDLIMYMKQLIRTLNTPLKDLYTELVTLWSSDFTRSNKLVPVISDAVRIAMQPSVFAQQDELKERVFELAIRGSRGQVFELSIECFAPAVYSEKVLQYVQSKRTEEISPSFIIEYIKYVTANYPDIGIKELLKAYPPAASMLRAITS
ncbi:hypothetical protein PAPHI01_0850 [Pancytospora philotis]|nr:hypothetical protein PAPHI01_0850 [Pancytospora philotis]